jgi:predicted lactoylglutathione lyase
MMSRQIYVNLPVKEPHKAITFFTQFGFSFKAKFTDKTVTCMVVSDTIFVMLLTEPKFQTFTPKAICDATQDTEVLLCLSGTSRQEVNELVRTAVTNGGTTYNNPQDHGFMYVHGFQDLDGHIWEWVYMEPDAVH